MDNIEVIVQENVTQIEVIVSVNEGGAGVDGLSAYQIALQNGFIGTEQAWLDSLVGVDGSDGIQGIQGETGLTGSNGIDGATGAKGDSGIQGVKGDNGTQGIQGIQGVKGDTGAAGTNGTNGAGSVISISSINTDIDVTSPTTTPVLTLNSGTGANQIPKRDGSGNIPNLVAGIVQGDILYGTGAGTIDRLPKNTTATRYLSNTGTSNAPVWAQVNLANGITGIVVGTNGGTGQNFYAVGDLLYASTTTNLTKRNIGTTGQVLKVVSGLPTWADADYFQNFLASGNGSATSITITHGLTGITGTSKVIVQPLNTASAGVLYVTISSTTITIVYGTSPANGTNNLSYSIMVRP